MDSTTGSRRQSSTKSGTSDMAESNINKATSTPPSTVTEYEGDKTPSIRYTTIKNLLAAIKNTTGDRLRVEGVTPEMFARILAARSEQYKFRLFFFPSRRLVIVTIPSGPHEYATKRLAQYLIREVEDMGLNDSIQQTASETFRSVSGQAAGGSGEGDDSFTIILPNGELRTWPTVVLETGYSQSEAAMRLKMEWWFVQSNYAVKAVLLVKIWSREGAIVLEKWKAVRAGVRPGATTTRRSEAMACQPRCMQTVQVSRPGVGPGDAARLNPDSYVVARGPLRLEFEDVFLRHPGHGEHDIVFDEPVLKDMAVRVWRRVL